MPDDSATPASKVFVVNFAGHNYSDAQRWGELEVITDGYVSPKYPDRMLFEIAKAICGSVSEDWILPSGMLLLNMLAAVVQFERHGQIKLLVFDKKKEREPGEPDYREVVIVREQLQLLFNHFDKVSP